MNKKMLFGILLTAIGLIFSVICFINALLHPWNYNGIGGLYGSFLGTQTLVPFVVALLVMCIGLVICYVEAYRKNK